MSSRVIGLVVSILCGMNLFDTAQCNRIQHSRGIFAVTTPIPLEVAKLTDNTLQPPPKIVDIDIVSKIQFRYAKTVVKAYVKNPSLSRAQEVRFNMVLPDTAFISNFTIQIQGDQKIHVAKVSEKEEADEIYNKAVIGGQSAGIVDADTRDANQITIRSNLKQASKMVFTLTYEELLKRHISKYEHIIHVNPGQIVEDFKVNVYINESLPVINLNVPELKTSPNEITSQLRRSSIAKIETSISDNPTWAHIQFKPTSEDQKRIARLSHGATSSDRGMTGQFIVQYDVDRKAGGNDIQILDGYFVHFFAPDKLQQLPKHVVFVLDISGSMSGKKLEQTKDAMVTIIDDLTEDDYFNILTFSGSVQHWIPKQYRNDDGRRLPDYDYYFNPTAIPSTNVQTTENVNQPGELPPLTYKGTDSIRKEALKFVLNLNAGGGTNINLSLMEALDVIQKVRVSESLPSNVKPIIIFLTDGEPTSGVTNGKEIRENVIEENKDLNVPIYGLAFGAGADFNLVKGIAQANEGFARKIYEASDAAIQLEEFYLNIASPLLTNVQFDYVGEYFKESPNKKLNTFFKGSEYIIAGKLELADHKIEEEEIKIIIIGQGQGMSSSYNQTISPCELPPMPRPLPYGNDVEDQNSTLSKWFNISNPYIPTANNWLNISKPSIATYRPCIPLPNPQQPKSEAENFIERLWAFLSIENFLNEKLSKLEIEKIIAQNITNSTLEDEMAKKSKLNKEKALDLALQYNFVTQLTSLVVVKPDEQQVNGEEVSSGTIINVEPVNSLGLFNRPSSNFNFLSRRRFGGPQSSQGMMMSHGPPGRSSGRGRGGQRRGRTKHYMHKASLPNPRSLSKSLSSNSYNSGGGSFNCPTCKKGMPQPTSSGTILMRVPSTFTIQRQSHAIDHTTTNYYKLMSVETTTEMNLLEANCSLIMYSKTYLRGNSITITNPGNSTVANLSAYSFDDKLTSLEVIGPCCWDIFDGVNFRGYSKRFGEGKYKSSTKLGSALAKEASSLRITRC